MIRPRDWTSRAEPDSRTARVRLWFARRLCPDSHRVVDVEDIVLDPRMALSDIHMAIQSIENGMDIHPMILVNAAYAMRAQTALANEAYRKGWNAARKTQEGEG